MCTRRKGARYCRTAALCFGPCTISRQPFTSVFSVSWLRAYSLHDGSAVPQGLLLGPPCPQSPALPSPAHNRTSHFHLALKTSFALLGGRFRSSVMACKQIRYISTFLLSVRATQTREIWPAQVFPNLLPMAR